MTGSRDWPDAARVWGALAALADQVLALTVVHGAAGRGVDLMAHRWVSGQQANGRTGISEEPHPPTGRAREGAREMLRNAGMVRKGGDARFADSGVLAAQRTRPEPHGSHGATDCADRAEGADIRTVRWYDAALLRAMETVL